MKFDFASIQRTFWESAPDKPGFKPVYAAAFCGIISLLEEASARSIDVSFPLLHGRTKVSEEGYSDSLKWLSEHGYWQYVPGKGRHLKARIYVDAPEFTPAIVDSTGSISVQSGYTPNFYPGSITPSMGVGTGGSIGGSTGVVGENPPPYPPIEVININNKTTTTHVCEGSSPDSSSPALLIPYNINLSPQQVDELTGRLGIPLLNEAMLTVSIVKESKGTVQSDYYCLVQWGIQGARERLQKASNPPPRYANGPLLPGSILPRSKTRIPD